jgi:MATE family multidrug resistance protein
MWIAIALNCVNIVASLLFVLVLKWDMFGVALGTVIANYTGLAMGLFFLRRRIGRDPNLASFSLQPAVLKEALHWEEMRRFFKVNGDVFLRTVCLSTVFTFITAASGRISETIRATDGILMMFFTLFSYIMDGFAYAGESLVGRYIGARQLRNLRSAVRLLLLWGLILTAFFTLLYALFSRQFLHIFTSDELLITAAKDYILWVLAIPVCGFAAFLFDGIFIGATASRTMRNAMFVATAAFFLLYFGAKALFDPLPTHTWNNILWGAFMAFLTLRGLLQGIRVRKDIYSQIQ